ncbi:transglutaminase domain-containing protein [Microbispora sp. RL4-1S]|uniref:Transglutaminase domain-containing protein n=1 Tax=Microbispora oryzae TaxID=2806554 RepID=A0A941AH63_9ACTN|nr:DUF3488 and transglutaminase-like domain-containing protein [Microbispora oryzae]MBP2702357.1 transglutaminase domain-containing protein [Microbispora oryzae]
MRLPVAAGLATAAVTTTLYPLFDGGAWLWASMGAILVTTLVGTAATRLAAPAWVATVVMPFALLAYVTAAFAASDAWLWFIPTPGSVARLAALIGSGFDDIQRYAAPVPTHDGIVLLTVIGVGLIALLADLCAVRLRRAALAGLPLLALFTVPAAVLTEAIGWIAFVLAASGYTGLLVADGRERLSRWGSAVVVRRSRSTGKTAPRPDTGRLALSGKRIGVGAIALAILVPALLPALSPAPLFQFGVGNGLGGGSRNIGIPDAIAKLSGELSQQSNATVLTYSSSDDQPRYLRIYSLDVFDGVKWTSSGLRGRPQDRVSEGPLPPPPGLSVSAPAGWAQTTISISDDVGPLRFLPLPYPPERIQVDGDWRADQSTLVVFSTQDEAAGLEYRVVTKEPRLTPEQLTASPPRPDGERRFLDLPDALDPRVEALARRVAEGASSPYEKAVKLQEWFTKTGGFTYSLDASGSGARALARFVLQTRSGYCEQFASAMAAMARMLGIPARVAIGYTGGTKIGDVWTVRTHDAHAWPELYFEGVGWLRFEPTPSGAAGQGTAQAPAYSLPVVRTASPTAGPTPEATSTSDDSADAARSARRDSRAFDRDLGAVPVVADPGLTVAAKVGIGAAAVLLLALVPGVARLLTRVRRRRLVSRGSSGTEAAWRELCDTLTDFGMARRPEESPRALGRRLTERYELDARTAASLTRIVTAEERLRYAASPAADGPVPADLAGVRRGLAAGVSRARRIGAVIAPMSTLLRIGAAGERGLDLFDRLEGLRLWPARRSAAGGPALNRSALDGSALDGSARNGSALTGSTVNNAGNTSTVEGPAGRTEGARR